MPTPRFAPSQAALPALVALMAWVTLPLVRSGRAFTLLQPDLSLWQRPDGAPWVVLVLLALLFAFSVTPLAGRWTVVRRAEGLTVGAAIVLALSLVWLFSSGVSFGVGWLLTVLAVLVVAGCGLSEAGWVRSDPFIASSILFVIVFVFLFIVFPLAMVLRSALVIDGRLSVAQFQRTLRSPLFFLLNNTFSDRNEGLLVVVWGAVGAVANGLYAYWRTRTKPTTPDNTDTTASLITETSTSTTTRVIVTCLRASLWGLALGILAGVLRYGRGALPTSLLIVAIVAPSCTLLGLAFALLGQRTRAPWLTRLLDVVGLLPIITPPFVLSFAMIFLLGRRGVVTFQLLGISSNAVYGIVGVSLAQILAFTPVSYLLLRGQLSALNPALEEAAQSLGAHPRYVLRTVTWPLLRPGLAAAFLLSMIESLADFGNPIILGGNRNYLATEVFLSLTGRYNQNEAAVYGVMLLGLVFLAFFLQQRFVGGASFITVTGKPSSGRFVRLPKVLELPLIMLFVLWFILIAALYGAILLGSVTRLWGVDYSFTWQHYRDFMTAGLPVLRYTLTVAAVSAVPAMLLGFLVAYLVVRQRFWGRRFVEFGSLLSFATPGTVMGVAYILAFNRAPWLLTASATIIVLALVFRNMPVSIRAAVAGLAQIDPSLEEASTMLRARSPYTLRRVVLPLLLNTLVTGLIFAFVSAVTAVSQVIFLVSPGNQLATVLLLGWIEQGQLGRGAAMGSILIVSMLLLILSVLALARRLAANLNPSSA